MSRKDIVRLTPYLRRYARALLGSRARGDAQVRAALESLLDDGWPDPFSIPAKVWLFRVFHRTWRKALNGHSIDSVHASPVDRRLALLTPEHRTALLLVLLEGFSLEEVADILEIPESMAQERFEIAAADLDRQLSTDVLIIEDEPIVALDLARMVEDLGHCVAATAATRTEAVAAARGARPGLVLADVRLADGSSGLEAAKDILGHFDVPVIFVTAFPEQLLTGEGMEPAFMITKPFREETVKALIGQALFFHQPSIP